jgi:tetratricopeptide (TPR) repeat protein
VRSGNTETKLMNIAFRAALTLLAALASAFVSQDAPAEAPPPSGSRTVLGHNALLADGSLALLNGQWEKGIDLTLMGLKDPASKEDRAAGYANLCAGYIALKQFERALESCDQSIAITDNNWRAWQNRAAANLSLGRIDDSMRDIERGLAINPDAPALQETLAIAREREKLQRQQFRALVES